MSAVEKIVDLDLGMALPDDGYIREYVEYGCQVTMAPPEFHLACALSQMSVMLGNRVVFSLGGWLYPANSWMVLLGPAGSAKSSAIRLAMRMLDDATDSTLKLPRESSPEKFLEILVARPTGYIEWGEFQGFLAKSSRKDWMAGMKEDLCELWESPSRWEKALKSGTTVVSSPAISILAGAVPSALGEWVKGRDLSGGFMSRFLFVVHSSPLEYVSMRSHLTPARAQLLGQLRKIWGAIPSTPNPITLEFSPDALAAWEDYDRETRLATAPDELSGFQGRLGTYVAKLALCYALARTYTPIPSVDDVGMATAFVEYTRKHTYRLALDELDSGRDAQNLRRLEKAISNLANGNAEGWVLSRDVLRRMHLKRREYDELLGTLVSTGAVEHEGNTSPGSPAERVRLSSPKRGRADEVEPAGAVT